MDLKSRKDCLNEALLLQSFNNNNIIYLYDSFMDETDLCLILELADGGDLSKLIKSYKDQKLRFLELDIWRFFNKIIIGLKHMHNANIMHRDMKPSNVFLTSKGEIKLGDLGLSRVMSSRRGIADSLVGTPYYLSPELIENHSYSFESDIWSLGCIVYEMAMLKSPFDLGNEGSLALVAQNILSLNYPPIDIYSDLLKQLVSAMLSRVPSERPTLDTISNAIDGYLKQNDLEANGLNNYQEMGVLGHGKYSTVYKSLDVRTNKLVAVKKIQIFEMDSSSRTDCFHESKLLQCLPHHPHIIQYIEAFLHENDLYLVLEMAESGDLNKLLKNCIENGTRLDERTIWKFASQVSSALAHMHSCRVMHRDIKPANMFLTQDDIKLGDLGLSRFFSSATEAGYSLVGSPYYLSPEAISHEGYTFPSDIWALGCSIYEMCMLQSPFYSPKLNFYALGKAIREADFPPISPEYSESLRFLVSKMLSVNIHDRPTAEQVYTYSSDAFKHFSNPAPSFLAAQQSLISQQEAITNLVAQGQKVYNMKRDSMTSQDYEDDFETIDENLL